MTKKKRQRIVVVFRKCEEQDDLVFESETGERVGYSPHSDENGTIGYKIWVGDQTTCIPEGRILKIVTDL